MLNNKACTLADEREVFKNIYSCSGSMASGIHNRSNALAFYQTQSGYTTNGSLNLEKVDYRHFQTAESGGQLVNRGAVLCPNSSAFISSNQEAVFWSSNSELLDYGVHSTYPLVLQSASQSRSVPKPVLLCSECNEAISCECQLYLHKILQHTSFDELSELKCQLCQKLYKRSSAFKSHLYIHSLRSDQVCSRCHAKNPSFASQIASEETFLPVSSRQYRCRLCGMDNSTLTELRIHYQRNHPKRKTDVVQEVVTHAAESRLEVSSSLPMGRISKMRASKFITEIASASRHKRCKLPFSAESVPTADVEHVDFSEYLVKTAVSKKRRQLKCKFCNKKMFSMHVARSHVLKHLGVKPFSCPLCRKAFSQKGTVDIHMAIHTAKDKISCSFCQRRFTFKQNLDVHMIKYHRQALVNQESREHLKALNETHSFLVKYGSLSLPLLTSVYRLVCRMADYAGKRYACRFCFCKFSTVCTHWAHETLHLGQKDGSQSYAQLLKRRVILCRANSLSPKDLSSKPASRVCPHRDVSLNSGVVLLPRMLGHTHVGRRNHLRAVLHLLTSPQNLSHCPVCSKVFTSPSCGKLHFVLHFLAEAFICFKCNRRFSSPLICLIHMRIKHGIKKKRRLRVVLHQNLPLAMQKRLGLKKFLATKCTKRTNASTGPMQQLQIPAMPIPQAVTFTEQLSQEVVWLTEPTMGAVVQSSAIIVPGVNEDQGQVLPVNRSCDFEQYDHPEETVPFPLCRPSKNPFAQSNQSVLYANDQVGFADTTLSYETECTQIQNLCQDLSSVSHMRVTPTGEIVETSTDQCTSFFGCCLCNTCFANSEALFNHSLQHPSSTHYTICLICGVTRPHNEELSAVCGACGANVLNHIESVQNGPIARFFCSHCNVAYTELEQLEEHVAVVTSSSEQTAVEVVAMASDQQNQVTPRQSLSRTRRQAFTNRNNFELPEEEVQRIAYQEPPPETSISERLLYEAACERNYRSYPASNRRRSDAHSNVKGLHVCSVCSFGFQRSSDLHRHIFLHTGLRPYGCKFCNRRFILPRRLWAHATKVHGHEGAVWASSILSGRPRTRRFPQPAKNVPSPSSLTCHLCSTTCGSVDALHSHMRIHTGTRMYACPHCNASFRTPTQRGRHLKVCQKCTQRGSWNTVEPIMGLPTNELIASRVHDAVVEAGTSMLWQCKDCHAKFPTEGEFAIHACVALPRTLHQLEGGGVTLEGPNGVLPPFHCNKCGKEFSRLTDLRRHIESHKSTKPFECKVCEAKFTQSGSLNAHFRSIHENSKRKFRCRQCAVSFFYRSSLMRHVARIHVQSSNGSVNPAEKNS